jgi:hypothetical protein
MVQSYASTRSTQEAQALRRKRKEACITWYITTEWWTGRGRRWEEARSVVMRG